MTDTKITLTISDTLSMERLAGPADANLRLIEESFNATITVRGDAIVLEGDADEVRQLTMLFSDLICIAESGRDVEKETVRNFIGLLKRDEHSPSLVREEIVLTYRGKAIRPKTVGQKRYVQAVRDNMVTFALGPAGTGKTYLAMAMAVASLKRKECGRIVLTRPVIEAGESLGFLPGTLQEKVDPYIRPLYDALFDMMDMERANVLLEDGIIEVAPLAFMRGRTFNDAFIILDEAQNTTPEQLKMFLTRLGFGSKMVITGDPSQLDRPRGTGGLRHIKDILGDVDGIAFCEFSELDVVRHSLVAAIVAAYEKYESKNAGRNGGNKN
jgi:phosphate starvation-inducible PhoH-like protein